MSLSLLPRGGSAEQIDPSLLQPPSPPRLDIIKESISYAGHQGPMAVSFLQIIAASTFRIVGLLYVFIYLPYCFLSN